MILLTIDPAAGLPYVCDYSLKRKEWQLKVSGLR
jgi:hypothetical protein